MRALDALLRARDAVLLRVAAPLERHLLRAVNRWADPG